ncbi:MAG: hypothetical protein IM477_18800 [Microcystis sp. M090S1]|uniref:hypothetical protein n=1 Tax=Microcystis sp. M090S1 TaxID=2771135 RepID=UPI002587A53F|nr:hypothetical protein [Microcystis sp. M090S1]MCA2814459.1 hypothetical protein [Microcystis sp. M090S1]
MQCRGAALAIGVNLSKKLNFDAAIALSGGSVKNLAVVTNYIFGFVLIVFGSDSAIADCVESL